MSENPINRIIGQVAWHAPSAMDLYSDFVKCYGDLVSRRREELRKIILEADGRRTPEAIIAYTEQDNLRDFEPRLHRLIHTFTAEAVKPLQEVLTSIAMRTPGPLTLEKP